MAMGYTVNLLDAAEGSTVVSAGGGGTQHASFANFSDGASSLKSRSASDSRDAKQCDAPPHWVDMALKSA